MSKLTGMKKTAFWGIAVVLLITLGVVLGQSIVAVVDAQVSEPEHGGDPSSVHVCVNTNNGLMLMVGPNNNCSALPAAWVPVDWAIQGPQGDPGVPCAGCVDTISIANDSVTGSKIANDTITDADVSPLAAINISKITGDAGVEFADLAGATGISTVMTNLGSLSITCPTSGFVVLQLSGTANFFEEGTVLSYGFGTSTTVLDLYSTGIGRLDGAGTDRWEQSLNAMTVTTCSLGTTTLYANAQTQSVFSSGTVNLGDLSFVATFFDKRY